MSDTDISQSSDAPLIGRLLIIGLGLIGGSIAMAVNQRKLAGQVVGVSRTKKTLELAMSLGIVDSVYEDLPGALQSLKENDLVVICVPTLAVAKIFEAIKNYLPKGITFTDVASAKGSVVSAVGDVFGAIPAEFVPGHPIAGSEKSGVEAARADLYAGHQVIITPLTETGAEHCARVNALWSGVGATVTEMPVAEHDRVLAATSHLPHLLAYCLVDTLAGMKEHRDIFRYAAGGFRDFTRIAASDPTMWHDITLANSEAIVYVLDEFSASLQQLRQAIINKNSDHLLGVYTRAREARNHFQKMLDQQAYLDPINEKMINYCVRPGGVLSGKVRVPGDKSISHRAIMLGALANGITEISGFLEGEDSLATVQAFRDMGVVIEGPDNGLVNVHGVGLNGLKEPPGALYLGNSGTSMRLLAGLLAGQKFDTVLTGDASLLQRPMQRVVEPLLLMGAKISTAENGRPPLAITGNQSLKTINYVLPIASAQVKSCVLLAGLYSQGETTVTEPAPTRDHTERMLTGCKYPVAINGRTVGIRGGGELEANTIDIPADISSAAFFMVAASIMPGSDIILEHVGINPTRCGVINILRLMGANIELLNERSMAGEPVADIRVRWARLNGIDIPVAQVPLAIDEFPVIFVAAACAEGTTTLTGAEELKVKESDRIQAMTDGLLALGISVKPTPDGIVIEGGQLAGGQVDSQGDHRIAMAFTIAGLRASESVQIQNCANIATSFPGFTELANTLGIKIVVEEV